MTSPPSKSLSDTANDLFEAVGRARMAGYILLVDQYGFLDLMDPESGKRTPVSSVEVARK